MRKLVPKKVKKQKGPKLYIKTGIVSEIYLLLLITHIFIFFYFFSIGVVQTRWSIIKQRYVDELQKERFSHFNQKPFFSTWEHFEKMSFMRNILVKKVDDREQTRERIQEIVSIQQHQDQSPSIIKTELTLSTTDVICVDDEDVTNGHRAPKTEVDLEWDPFEMILQVNGTENGN